MCIFIMLMNMLHNKLSEMLWIIVTRFLCKMGTLHDVPCTLKAGIFSLKRFSLLLLKNVFDLHITLEARYIWKHFRNNRICCFFTICKSRSRFGRIFCTAFETVCASSLAMCAYQIGETCNKQIPIFGFRQSRSHFFLNE